MPIMEQNGKPAEEKTAGTARRPRRKFPKKRLIILVMAFALAGGAAFGVKALFFRTEGAAALTERTTYGSLSTTLEGAGTTMPADSVTVTTASAAEITGVYVSTGDTVAAGDLLYTQDDSELDEQIEEYEQEITTLEEELDDCYEQLAQLSETMAALTVTAPFSGRITEVAADAGDSVMTAGNWPCWWTTAR